MKAFTMLMSLSILTTAGCGGASEPRQTAAPTRQDFAGAWQSTPLPVNPQPTPVKRGAAPLVYMVESG